MAKWLCGVTIKDQVLTHYELITVVYEIANLLNERPIGKQSSDISDGTYLCPNDLLLGRACARIPSGPFTYNVNSKRRFAFVQKLVDAFWVKMNRFYFPSLIVQQKWHTEKRNVCKGDIVILQDSNAVRGNWKLGKIDKVYPSSDGKVRKVIVMYKKVDSSAEYKGSAFTKVERPIQKVVVLLPAKED